MAIYLFEVCQMTFVVESPRVLPQLIDLIGAKFLHHDSLRHHSRNKLGAAPETSPMEEPNGLNVERCGDKRKAPSNAPNSKSKKPWGTDGPPPAEWIEVNISCVTELMRR